MKRFSYFLYLFLILISPLKAEENKNNLTVDHMKNKLIQQLEDYRARGQFTGAVSTSCMAYLSDYITNEQKIRLVEFAREDLYNSKHSNPKKVEKKIISFFIKIDCFPEFK